MAETALEQAQRHVREGEARVREQAQLVEGLKADGHDFEEGEKLLKTMETNLDLARQHLKREEEDPEAAVRPVPEVRAP